MDGKPPINEAHGGSPSLHRLASESSLAGSTAANHSSPNENPPSSILDTTMVVEEGSVETVILGDPDSARISVTPIGSIDSPHDGGAAQEPLESPLAPFVPTLGAWAKPLSIDSDPTMASLTKTGDTDSSRFHELSTPSQWPSLAAGQQIPSRRSKQLTRTTRDKSPVVPTKINGEALPQDLYPPEVKEDGKLRFPWAAKLNPSTRNLYRTTTPTYLEDGTPLVTIPSNLLLHGPENQKEYIIGQFYRCSTPSGGLIHAVVNKIWGRKCKIFTRKLGESSYLFHIPDESTRSWILQRGMWHVDDCLMVVAAWSPADTLSLPEISTIPVWVSLKNIPSRLYSRKGISRIASGLGEPILTHKPRLDPTLMGEAKILVEVELDKPFPQRIALDDKKGNISMVDVEYSWIPTKCGRCGHLGHKESRCLQQNLKESVHVHTFVATPISVTVPVQATALSLATVPISAPRPSSISLTPPIAGPNSNTDAAPITKECASLTTTTTTSPVVIEPPTTIVEIEPITSTGENAKLISENGSSTTHAHASVSTGNGCALASIPAIVHVSVSTPATIDGSVPVTVLDSSPDTVLHSAPTTPTTLHPGTVASSVVTASNTSPITTVIETESTVPLLENGNNLLQHSPMSVARVDSRILGSNASMIAPIDTNIATSVAISTDEHTLSTPPPQSNTSQATNNDDASTVIGGNPFAALERGVFTGYESAYDYNQRTRGGRHVKPTQKVQEMQWTDVRGRRNRGRGGRGGNGRGS